MKHKNVTRSALFTSIISLLLCVSMLVGTTFAWFTDSVVSGNNVIAAGNLDIELEYWDGTQWADVSGQSNILTNKLWEPGVTEIAYLRVANAGSLALKYQLGINIVSETAGVNKAGEAFMLSDYIQFGVVENVNGEAGAYTNREDAVAAVANAQKISAGYTKASAMMPREELYLALVVYMPTTVGNEANHNGTVPKIDLGINVFATQQMHEEDTFGDDYDKYTAVFTVAEANAMMLENKDVALVNCDEPEGILVIPTNYTGTLVLNNVTVASVQEDGVVSTIALEAEESTSATAKIAIVGKVVVSATEDGMSAITGTNLNISGTGNLTAIGKGAAAFGIGGMNTKSITISGITIDYVEGGCAYGFGDDTKYYKDAPEGGAAIGSAKDGAVITLNNVTVTKAIGGSKAAAIGARYHTGVTVNITNSVIGYAEGGVSAAGIGGSRVSSGAAESGVTINITGSNVTAKGGAYGAGIGAGYDTHCQSEQPLCTINITDSTINATGGKYAAGVGTGFHTAALAGEIKNSTVTAASGDKVYKDTYTSAMDIGFGVVDPAREGQQTDSKLIYNGVVIRCNTVNVESTEDLVSALANGKNVALSDDIIAQPGKIMVNGGLLDGNDNAIVLSSGSTTKPVLGTTGGTIQNVTVDGSGKSAQGIGAGMTTDNPLTKDLYLNNVTVDNVMYAVIGTANNGVKVIVTDSELYGAFSYIGATVEISDSVLGAGKSMCDFFEVGGNTSFTDCSFKDSYCFMAYDHAAGSAVTFTNCTVNGTKLTAENFKSLLIDTRWDYSSELCSTNLKDCTITVDGVAVAW